MARPDAPLPRVPGAEPLRLIVRLAGGPLDGNELGMPVGMSFEDAPWLWLSGLEPAIQPALSRTVPLRILFASSLYRFVRSVPSADLLTMVGEYIFDGGHRSELRITAKPPTATDGEGPAAENGRVMRP